MAPLLRIARSLGLAVVLPLVVPMVAAQSPAAREVAERIVSVGSIVSGEGPIWSADGRSVYFASSQGGSALWSVPAAGGPAVRLTRDIATGLVRLSPAGDRLAFLSDKSGNPEIWLWDLAAGAERRLTDLGARINAFSWSPDGRTLAVSALRFGQFDLWRVDVESGKVIRLTDDPRYETYPAWTPDGATLLYIRSDDRWADHEILALPAGGGTSRVVATDRDLFDYGTIGTRARFGYPLVSPDGKAVLFRSHRSGWLNYWVVGIDGSGVRALAAEAADQSDARWSPDGKSVAFVSNRNGAMDLRVVAAGGGAARVVVPVTVGVVSSPEWSPEGGRIAYTFGTPTRPADLFVVDVATGATRQLTSSIAESVQRTLIEPEKVSYRSDEFTIPAYLFKPPAARAGERFPGILYIHGGPTGQFSDAWLSQAQFLARMGYVVLAPNIRGSSGYGKAFEDANNPCWTHCDLRDVLQGVAFLKTLPMVDGAKMGITGISYGGIMSMGAIAHAPGVFQAAVPQSGYANWISFQDYNTEIQHAKLNAYEWGPYPDSAHVYRRNSAIFSAEKVATPAFVLHGDGVTQSWRPGVYPITASLEFVHALDRYNKPVKYKVYPGETYYVNGRENSRQVLLDMLEWFDRYLKDGVTGPR
ncbi:MAG: S9 family peptidase [Gemmatimonadales bacterium]|nr:S9 family peptidase [Gemmatimonadales bacterium]